jgi:NAD(P)-dependent dehydrogenase (short-subunit alcohol dehydrogenase family)
MTGAANRALLQMHRTVLLTGAGGGLGLATARRFAREGWLVFAGDIRPPEPEHHIFPLVMDVTDSASVDAAVAQIDFRAGGLGAVVNFAGILDLGPMMEISAERFSRTFEVNVVGTHRVNRAVLPLIQAGHGRIVNISSEAALHRGGATGGPYTASKHAVDIYSDALRQELMFLGVPVIVIRPGVFKTEMGLGVTQRQLASLPAGSPYESVVRTLAKIGERAEEHSYDPAILADAVWDAVSARRPRARIAVKADRVRALGANLPPAIVDRIVRRVAAKGRA